MGPEEMQLIEKLLEIKHNEGLTYQEIAARCEAAGQPLSASAIQRVLTGGAETVCRPRTLQIIQEALIPTETQNMETVLHQSGQALDQLQADLGDKQKWVDQLIGLLRRRNRIIKYLVVALVIVSTLFIVAIACLILYITWDIRHPAVGAFR